jgi:hypothetical protein
MKTKLAIMSLALASCTAPAPSVLELALPLARTDDELCRGLSVDLTFDRTDDLASPPLDQVALAPKEGATCTWVLAEERRLLAGSYDLIVRFKTNSAVSSCSAPILVGAYVKRGLAFPFPEDFSGLTAADFASRKVDEALLGDPSVRFDPDDDGRESLAELAQGSDPCKPSSVPVPSLEIVASSVTETSTVIMNLSSSDADGVAHVVELRIAHANGPNVGTEEIVYRAYTDGRSGGLVDGPQGGERWSLRASADSDARDGAARWELRFVPDEPFVGTLDVRASADDGQGNVLARTSSIAVRVEDVDDPTRLLFGDQGAPQALLRFAEQGMSEHRFRFEDDDLMSDVGTWTPEIVRGPIGLTLRRDAAFWVLRWSPTNDDALLGDQRLDLRFLDGVTAKGQTSITLEISPLFNDPPMFVEPPVGELALPAAAFAEHRVNFAVVDPDRANMAPSCAATVMPIAGTTCTNAFSSVRCEPTGPRADDRWPFALILSPSASYETACGSAPSFSASLVITDVPPTGASNGPLATGTGGTPLELRTANVVAAAVVSGGSAAVPGYTNPSPPLIHGALKKAIIQVNDSGGNEVPLLVDLTRPAPSFIHRFPQSELCSLDENQRPKDIFAADEVNGRMLVVTRGFDGSSCATNGVSLVNVSARTATFFTSVQTCGEPWNDRQGNPVVDARGNIYVPCVTSPGRIARFAPDGTLSTKTISIYRNGSDDINRRTGIVTDSSGKSWLVWPDAMGLVIVDLSTFDQATPSAERITVDAGWNLSTIDDSAVDPYRRSFLIAYNRRNLTAQLLRVRFETTGRVLDAPLDLGDVGGNTSNGHSYMRLVLRDAGAGSSDPGPDLVVSPGSNSDPRPHVDLDSWSISAVRPVTDYFLGSGSAGIFQTPDKRFYTAPTTSNYESSARGIYLYRFDPMVARQFIELAVPNGGSDWAGRTESSESGNLMVISEADGSGQISVVYFVEAEAGRD